MPTLKEARENGKIAQFVKEHRRDPKGDAVAFNATLDAMAGKSKAIPATSKKPGIMYQLQEVCCGIGRHILG